MNTEEKLVDLETRYSYQEDLLQQLNDIVTKQDGKIELLEKQIRLMAERLRDLQSESPQSPASTDHEIPPHY